MYLYKMSLSGYMIYPQKSSCSVFKYPRATPLLPCSCVQGTLPMALTLSPNLPPNVLNIHKSTLHLSQEKKKKKKQKSNSSTYRSMYSEKINMETFQNFKSQYSVTKHIIPLIKLTYYTYEWYCLKTLEPQFLEVQSQQGDLWDTWNFFKYFIYIYVYITTPVIFMKKAKLMIMETSKTI